MYQGGAVAGNGDDAFGVKLRVVGSQFRDRACNLTNQVKGSFISCRAPPMRLVKAPASAANLLGSNCIGDGI
jgi:hypothetical protein